MAILINLKHPEIIAKSQGKMMMSLRKDEIYFSKALASAAKMLAGKTITFTEFTNKFGLFVCSDDVDGFPVAKPDERGGMVIRHAGLLRFIEKQTGHKVPCSFYVQETKSKVDNLYPIFEILVDKTIERLSKQ